MVNAAKYNDDQLGRVLDGLYAADISQLTLGHLKIYNFSVF